MPAIMQTAFYFSLLITFALSATPVTGQQEGSETRTRDHIDNFMKVSSSYDNLNYEILEALKNIYVDAIKPMEEAYKFSYISEKLMREGDILSLPKMTFIGPWSTGKSTMINYLLNIEDSPYALPSGASPTTTDFTILRYGKAVRATDGTVLAMESSYTPLKKFGHSFLDKIHGYNFPRPLLQKVTIIDTPGIIENQKQRERSYPFNDVCKWFLDHSQIIILVFDYTKLDVGVQLEKLFQQLKGHESKVRIILNKADVLSTQELMRVYGTLFWGLAPLMNVTEPPRVYVGSFWSKNFSSGSQDNHNFFQTEEVTLLQDLKIEIDNWVENKIAALRQHALFVRNHALTIDRYIHILNQNTGLMKIFTSRDEKAKEIVTNPEKFNIPQYILSHGDISIHDTLSPASYKKLFSLYNIDSFKLLSHYCDYFSRNCFLQKINTAINTDLPNLLHSFQTKHFKAEPIEGHCDAKSQNC